MAGERATKEIPLKFLPGVASNAPDREEYSRWKRSNRVRWFKGLAEKIGGWERLALAGVNNGVMIGVARALHDWSSLDTQQWIAVGTNCKLYLVNNGTLYDITPIRVTANLSNAISTVSGSQIVTVVSPDHRAAVGDHITITATSTVGGLTIDGDYDIVSVPNPNALTVLHASAAASTAAGGGSIAISFNIGCGLAENGLLTGFGTGPFGLERFGTQRAIAAGVPARMRTWSLDNWGEDLLAAQSDGELYWWDKTAGPNAAAVLIPEAPTDIQRMLVSPTNRHVILLGCSGIDGVADPMLIRWSESENFSQWTSTTTNSAGDLRLDYGSRLITGLRSRGQILVWSDTQLYAMAYQGPPFTFGKLELGACKIVGPNAAVDVNGVARFMGFDDFFVYDGTLRPIPCDLHLSIFGDDKRNIEGVLDRTQTESVCCASYMAKNEVTWYFKGLLNTYYYVTLNYDEANGDCWYMGTMSRTAFHDVSEAITGFKTNPYGAFDGHLYRHEVGTDEVDGDDVTPQPWFLESYDNNVGGADAVMLVNNVTPSFKRMTGSMLMTLKKKSKPQQQDYQRRGPYVITPDTVGVNVRCKAAQIALRLESAGGIGEDFRMGTFFIDPVPYGGRVGIHVGTDIMLEDDGEILDEGGTPLSLEGS